MTEAPVLDRTQRAELAKAARREEILRAARRVFAERGFRGTTIADIAEEAGIALGTIYLYFPSKDDVFAALSQQLGEMIIAAAVDVPPTDTVREAVERRIDNIFAACGENRDLIRLWVLNTDPGAGVTQRLRDSDERRALPLVEAISRGMEGGYIRPGDARIMTKLILGLVSNAVYQAFVLSDGSEADLFRRGCSEMIVSYLEPATV